MASFSTLIKLPTDILNMMPIIMFQTSNSKLSELKAPTGANTEDMPAAREILSLFSQFQSVLNSYSSLITYDGDRMKKVVEAFVKTDLSK